MKKETKKRQEMYADFGNNYEAARYGDEYKELYRQIRNETLITIINQHFDVKKTIQALEIGCGTGLTLSFLSATRSNIDLQGLDFSHTMLAQAHQKLDASDNAFGLIQGNVFSLPFDSDSFDVVYNTRFIHQFNHHEKQQIYKEMNRILCPGGVIISEFYTRHGTFLRSLRGEKEQPLPYQCPTASEVSEVVGKPCEKWPVRMIALRAIYKSFGSQVLKRFISMTHLPILSLLREEYFVVTKK